MLLSASAALWFLPFVIPIAVWVAWSDMATMKIPNKAVMALMVVFAVIGLIAYDFNITAWAWQWTHFVVILAAGFVMTITGVVGAGDAKFAAAAAPFVMRADSTNLIAIFGICCVLGFVTHRLARISPIRKMVPHWESWERTRDFPMGYPLAGTLVIYLIMALVY